MKPVIPPSPEVRRHARRVVVERVGLAAGAVALGVIQVALHFENVVDAMNSAANYLNAAFGLVVPDGSISPTGPIPPGMSGNG